MTRAAEVLMTDRDRDPFGFHLMRYTRSAQESKALNFLSRPGGHHQRQRHGRGQAASSTT